MIGKVIHTILKSSVYIQSVLTENGLIKVFPLIVPDSVNYPAVEYGVISNDPSWCKIGIIATETYRVQFDVYDIKFDNAQMISSTIKAILHNLSGVVIANSWLPNGIWTEDEYWVTPNGAYWGMHEENGEPEYHVEIIQYVTERDVQEFNDDKKGIDIFHRSMDFYFKIKKL